MKENKLETLSNLFEGNEIRSIWDAEKEDYYFSVVDVIGVLTESTDPAHYWRTLKSRMINTSLYSAPKIMMKRSLRFQGRFLRISLSAKRATLSTTKISF